MTLLSFQTFSITSQLIKLDQNVYDSYVLTDEGREVLEQGSHEKRVLDAVPADGIKHADLQVG